MRQDSRTALGLLTIGLIALFTYGTVYSPTTYDPREIQQEHLGTNVRLHGNLYDIHVNGDVTFLRLDKRPGLDIVSFDRVRDIQPNTTITIYGTVDLYHGQLEILADRIVVADS